ncbi:MAG: hypothetical protein ACSHXY_07045 [Alphaproteobacteria bacterium]
MIVEKLKDNTAAFLDNLRGEFLISAALLFDKKTMKGVCFKPQVSDVVSEFSDGPTQRVTSSAKCGRKPYAAASPFNRL